MARGRRARKRDKERREHRGFHEGGRSKRAQRDLLLVNRWKNKYLPAAIREKKRFQQDADKVDKYFSSNHDHLYTDELSDVIDTTNLICLTVNLAAQVRAYMGPHLYAKNPIRTVTANTSDTVLQFFAHVSETYLNGTPGETKLKEHSRKEVDDGLLPGRGCTLTTKHQSKGLICSQFVAIDNVLIDPDACSAEDALWVAIRCREPIWKLRKRYPDTTETLQANLQAVSESGVEKKRSLEVTEVDVGLTGHSSHLVEYWKIWTKFGSGLVKGKPPEEEGAEKLDLGATEDGDRYRYLVIAANHDRPLYEGDWPIALHLDDEWPMDFLDFTPTREGAKKDTLWPVSLMKLGLSHQQAIDLLSTILINKLKQSSRDIFGLLGTVEEEVREAIQGKILHAVVPLKGDNSPTDIRQILQRLDLGQVPPELLAALEWHERKFGEITGLNPILKGGLPHDETQLRSATEAAMRDRNSRSRLEDMAERVESFNSRKARREQVAMRLALEPEDVERVVADKIVKPWKVRFSVGPKTIDVYRMRSGFWPAAGQYYETQEQAQQVAAELQAAVADPGGPLARAWSIKNPGAPWAPRVEVVEVDVAELWFDTAGMDAERITNAFHVSVEAGSARRQDHTLQAEQSQFLLSVVGAVAQSLQLWDTLNECWDYAYDILQVPKAKRVMLPVEQLQQQAQAAQQAAAQEQAQALQQEHQGKVALETIKNQGKAQVAAMQSAGSLEQVVTGAAAKLAFDPPGGGGVR